MPNGTEIETLVDLEDGYVIVQPDDVSISKVIERKTQAQSDAVLHDIVLHLWKIRATPTIRTKYPSDKPRDKHQRYYHALISRLTRPKSRTWGIETHDFDRKFLAWNSTNVHDKTAVITIADYGEAKAGAEYIYKRVKIQLGAKDSTRTVLFQPSKYLLKEDDIWALVVLVGEDGLTSALENNGMRLDRMFIENVLATIKQPFFLSKNGKHLFAVDYDGIKKAHGPLRRMTAKQALEFATVPQLEEAVEKISVSL